MIINTYCIIVQTYNLKVKRYIVIIMVFIANLYFRRYIMNTEAIKQTLEQFKTWTFTIANVNNIIHDKCKLVEYDNNLVILQKYDDKFAVHYSVILDIRPNYRILDIVILMGIRR
jgi:hypothetical protein